MRRNDTLKRHILFSMLLILSLVFLGGIGEAAKFKLEVKAKKANIRLKPSLKSPVITQVSRGTKLNSEEQIGNWFKIKIKPQKGKRKVIGYIHQSTVNILVDLRDVSAEAKVRKKEIGAEERGITGKGLKLGLNLASLGGGDVKSTDSKMGFSVGGFLTYRINKLIAIQPEILVTQKKANSESDVEGGTWKYRLNLTYLEIPVLAKFTLPIESSLKPSVYGGPFFALKLSGKGKSEFTEEVVDKVVGGLESYDFGLVFGADIEFTLGFFKHGKFSADLRYNLGLVKINTEKDIKTRAISFMLGYYF